jgi:SAM-dependent methyltransferase
MKIAKLNSRHRLAGPKLPPQPFRLDIGCGPHPREGFRGADRIAFPGVEFCFDLRNKWPWKDGSVDEAHSSHCLEHFESMERVHFTNELFRVLKPGAKATIITPHWSSCRAYGDPTHKWPPMGEFFWFYLKKEWRMVNAPHTDAQHLPDGFTCNFDVTWGYSLNPEVAMRNQEYQQMAMTHYKEAVMDMIATLTALK